MRYPLKQLIVMITLLSILCASISISIKIGFENNQSGYSSNTEIIVLYTFLGTVIPFLIGLVLSLLWIVSEYIVFLFEKNK